MVIRIPQSVQIVPIQSDGRAAKYRSSIQLLGISLENVNTPNGSQGYFFAGANATWRPTKDDICDEEDGCRNIILDSSHVEIVKHSLRVCQLGTKIMKNVAWTKGSKRASIRAFAILERSK